MPRRNNTQQTQILSQQSRSKTKKSKAHPQNSILTKNKEIKHPPSSLTHPIPYSLHPTPLLTSAVAFGLSNSPNHAGYCSGGASSTSLPPLIKLIGALPSAAACFAAAAAAAAAAFASPFFAPAAPLAAPLAGAASPRLTVSVVKVATGLNAARSMSSGERREIRARFAMFCRVLILFSLFSLFSATPPVEIDQVRGCGVFLGVLVKKNCEHPSPAIVSSSSTILCQGAWLGVECSLVKMPSFFQMRNVASLSFSLSLPIGLILCVCVFS